MADRKVFPVDATVPENPTTTFGPFGDKALHGTKLLQDTAKAKPDGETEYQTLHWGFSYWGPADKTELLKLVNAKPDMVLALVHTALGTKARAQSWAENRGGAVTVDVRVDGVLFPRLAIAVVEMLKSSGKKVEVVPRVKKAKK